MDPLNRYFQQIAWEQIAKGISRTWWKHRLGTLVWLTADGIGLFVDAKDEAATAFFARMGFEPTPSDPLTLVMPTESIRQLVA